MAQRKSITRRNETIQDEKITTNEVQEMKKESSTRSITSTKQQEYENPSGNIRLVSIPRTVRWRLQLGLLGIPIAPPPETEDENDLVVLSKKSLKININTNEGETNKKEKVKKKIDTKRSVTFHDIETFEYNMKMVNDQRLRFDLLTKRHMWKGSPLDILGDNTEGPPNADKPTEEEEDNKEDNKLKKAMDGMDPLSAILMEQEQKEHKTTIQTLKDSTSSDISTSSSWSMFYSSRELINMITKDLDRLPPFHFSTNIKSQLVDMKDLNVSHPENETRDKKKGVLLQILFMYAKEYPDIGYRQGMHEILSFTLLAIELDYETQEAKLKKAKCPPSILLFLKSHLLHDTYTLFEMIMYHLSPSYDTCILKRPPHCTPQIARRARPSSSPMQAMGLSILNKVRRSGGEVLYKLLSHTINVPPQLYCTRWVRLMLCREFSTVAGVLTVWDAFFSLISPHPNSSTLMEVLEYAAAVMILLQKDQLLKNHEYDGDDGDSIQLLMNYPPMNNYDAFLAQLRYMVFTNLGVNNKHTKKMHNNTPGSSASVEHTIDQVSTQVTKSWSKAFQSIGGSYHSIVNNVEKTYKAAIKHTASDGKNALRHSGTIIKPSIEEDVHSTMSLTEIETSLDESITVFKTFLRRVSDELASSDITVPMQQDVIEAITKLQKVKLNVRNCHELHNDVMDDGENNDSRHNSTVSDTSFRSLDDIRSDELTHASIN